jgi:hypothetical protein
MKTCPYTGCDAPKSECSGACMTHSMFSTKARPCEQFYSSREQEQHIDCAGPEPLQMAQAAAGYVAVLMAVIALVAFAVGYFS